MSGHVLMVGVSSGGGEGGWIKEGKSAVSGHGLIVGVSNRDRSPDSI